MADSTTIAPGKVATANIFDGVKAHRSLTQYTLMRGVTDFGNLAQFNLFETGYSVLTVISIPKFLTKLKDTNTVYNSLIETYTHILEYEFRGLEGLDNITADTSAITNGISTLDVITKVTMQSNAKFQMRYFEKSGSTITKVHELFLRGIKDPRTQVKRYNGLISTAADSMEAGYENETFSFLYFVTDNTMTNIEKAYFIVSAQPTSAETSMYNSEKGTIDFKEITVEFNGYPITGPAVNAKAKEMLAYINTKATFDDTQFKYTGVAEMASLLEPAAMKTVAASTVNTTV